MRQGLKVAISLLVSVLLFAAFAVLAFSGLFNVLQASFFLPRVQQGYEKEIQALGGRIEKFHAANLERFLAVARKDFAAASFAPALPAEVMRQWADALAALNVSGVRVVSADGQRIVFSSFSADAKNQTADRFTYRNYSEVDPSVPSSTVTLSPGDDPKLFIDGAQQRLLYSVPVYQPAGGAQQFRGTAVFYLGALDLLADLQLMPQMPVTAVTLVGNDGVLLNFSAADARTVSTALVQAWRDRPGVTSFSSPVSLAREGGDSRAFLAFSERLRAGGVASLLVPASTFEMTDLMKGLLLATFFLTVFLILYLLINLRSDPLDVLRQRVKRFQIQLVTELIEGPGGADWSKWGRELESRKEEITWQIQRGIGRVSKKQKPVIDEYMAKSWNEIIELISRRSQAPQAPAVGALDLSRLEALIKTALQSASFALPAQKAGPGRELPAAGTAEAPRAPAPAAVQEEAVEEVEEVEPIEEAEAVEEVEEAEAAEEVEELEEAEPVEEAEAVEEIEEAEAVEEVEEAEAVEEVEELEEAEPVEDAEAVEEVADAEPVEEAAEAEPVEEVPAAPATEETAAAAPEAPGGVEAVEELDELEAVEDDELAEEAPEVSAPPAVPAVAVGERMAATPAPSAAFAQVETSSQSSFIQTLEPAVVPIDSPDETLEELEAVQDLQPLPPLPFEEGLEYLPAADEEAEAPPIDDGGEEMGLTDGDSRRGYLEDTLKGVEPEEVEELPVDVPAQAPIPDAAAVDEADLEELESAESVGDLTEAVPGGALGAEEEPEDEIPGMIAAGIIKTWTLPEIQKIVDEAKSAIVMQDGVFRIKDEVYAGSLPQSREHQDSREASGAQDLRDIARQVVGEPAEEEQEDAEAVLFGGIRDLIREEQTIDLSEEITESQEAEREVTLSIEREKSSPIFLKRNGLDYEEFLSLYPRSFTHTSQMKSLVEVSRRVAAVSACLLTRGTDGFSVSLTVGLNEKSTRGLRFDEKKPMSSLLLSQKKAFAVNRNPAELRTWQSTFDADDLRYMKRIVMLPVTFRSQDGYLLLAFAADADIGINTILTKLLVR